MLLGELWWAQSAGAIPGNPLRAFVSVAVAMFLDASGFHAGSFAPALSGRKVHPVYRLRSEVSIGFGQGVSSRLLKRSILSSTGLIFIFITRMSLTALSGTTAFGRKGWAAEAPRDPNTVGAKSIQDLRRGF